jgi:hypothetical protein
MLKLNRTIQQWRGGDPLTMATCQSGVAIQFAFMDAKHDILALHQEVERLQEAEPKHVALLTAAERVIAAWDRFAQIQNILPEVETLEWAEMQDLRRAINRSKGT